MNKTYFDCEWANSKNKSICQIGIVCEDPSGEPVIPEADLLINPKDSFDSFCSKVHGITAEDVKDAPNFSQIWSSIEKAFTNSIVVGHNVASADLDALCKNLTRYGISIPELYYIDTLEVARDLIPPHVINDYTLTSLCQYFDLDTDGLHDAFTDACVAKDILNNLLEMEAIDFEQYVRKYDSSNSYSFEFYVSDPICRKAVADLYGFLKGIQSDGFISEKELSYLKEWISQNDKVLTAPKMNQLKNILESSLEDGVLTNDEINSIEQVLALYLQDMKASPETSATQVLNGILEGIIADNEVTEDEVATLATWLYENSYMEGHFPYDKLTSTVKKVLNYRVLTKEELQNVLRDIKTILNPVEAIEDKALDVNNKNVCLSGTFKYGSKEDVASFLQSKGAIIVDSVSKKTNILIVGSSECESYAFGTFGTKVKKAMEINQKGKVYIDIVKESEILS